MTAHELDDERMSIILYEDRLTDDWITYSKVFETVSENEALAGVDFYGIDARAYPDLEDTRLQKSITRFRSP